MGSPAGRSQLASGGQLDEEGVLRCGGGSGRGGRIRTPDLRFWRPTQGVYNHSPVGHFVSEGGLKQGSFVQNCATRIDVDRVQIFDAETQVALDKIEIPEEILGTVPGGPSASLDTPEP